MRTLPKLTRHFHAPLVLLLLLELGCGSTPIELANPVLPTVEVPKSLFAPANLSGYVSDRITSVPIAGATVIYQEPECTMLNSEPAEFSTACQADRAWRMPF